MATPLLFGEEQRQALRALRERAAANPVDMLLLIGPDKKIRPGLVDAHRAQMNDQTVMIPVGFLVTYSIESGHPVGTCRHMSMSSPAKGRLPAPHAIDMVAEILGFIGGHQSCVTYVEELQRGSGRAQALNVIQPLSVLASTGTVT